MAVASFSQNKRLIKSISTALNSSYYLTYQHYLKALSIAVR